MYGESESAEQEADSQVEQQRAEAWGYFHFFSELARRCPLRVHTKVLEHLVDEHRIATNAPSDRDGNAILSNREELLEEVRKCLLTLEATWSEGELRWNTPAPDVEVAKGMTRFIIIRLSNETATSLSISANTASIRSSTSSPVTIMPGKSQPVLLEIADDSKNAELFFHNGDTSRSLSLPIVVTGPGRVLVQLIDGESNKQTPARVWLEGSDGKLRLAGPYASNRSFTEKPVLLVPTMGMAAVPFFYADGSFELEVPPGSTTITMERGFEHELTTATVNVLPGETREVSLVQKRLCNAATAGWVSGDTHIHWVTNAWNVDLPLQGLAFVQRAEDLRVANNLTLLHRTDVDAFIKPSQAPIGPVAGMSDREYHIEMAEEYRNQNLYGHLCFLNLQWLVLPIGTGPQIAGDDSLDYPINKTAILDARGQGGISIEAHGTGANHELPLNAIHGLTDSVDQIDPVDYYRLLDCGFQLPLTNGSDHPARIVGCARSYVQIDGPFDYEKWIDGIRRGRTFTTSGPLLFLTVDDHGPGSVVLSDKSQNHRVKLHAVSRFPLGHVQLLSNGVILKELETSEREVTLELDLQADESRWVVARCSRNGRWNALWHPDIAHTSAVYVHQQGRSVFREEAALEWIQRIRSHSRDILLRGQFANTNQRNEALAYVQESVQRFERIIMDRRVPDSTADFSVQRDRLLMQAGFVSHVGHESDFTSQLAASDTYEALRKGAEPLTLLRVTVTPDLHVELVLVRAPDKLVQHRSHRFLVSIHNQARVKQQLIMEAANPPLAADSLNEAGHRCFAGILENLLSSSWLSGDEHAWKLMELRCEELGTQEIQIRASLPIDQVEAVPLATAEWSVLCVPRTEYRRLLSPVP